MGNEPMDIVWKDIPSNPTEKLTKMSQFTGAYATATMDKATKVSIFLRQREEKKAQLERRLQIEKENVNRQAVEQIAQLQQNMKVLKISHEAEISANNMQIQGLQEAMEKYEYVPNVNEFIKYALQLNSLLSKQQDLFCQIMSHVTPYLITNDQLRDKPIDQRNDLKDLNAKIFEFIEWKENEEGRRANILDIEETHKDIFFTDWDVRIKHAQLAVERAAGVEKNIVKVVNYTLNTTNLMKEGNPKALPNLNDLDQNQKAKVKTQMEAITKLSKANRKEYWQFLVKPYKQIMRLNCSLHSSQTMLPPLTDVIFIGEVRTQFGEPPHV